MKNKKLIIILISVFTLVLVVVAWFGIGREKLILIGVTDRLYENGNHSGAITALKINTKIYPRSAQAYSALANAYFYSGERSECLKSIKKAREIDPYRQADIILWKKLTLVPENFKVPVQLETEAFCIRPLKATDVQLDYEAIMSSIEHLKGVLGDDWPDKDMTIDEDIKALELHEKGFERRERFVYTVMNLDESECLGCIYIRSSRLDEFDAEVTLWVTKKAFNNGFDDKLFETVKNWLEIDWPFERIIFPGREIEWEMLYNRLGEQDKNLH